MVRLRAQVRLLLVQVLQLRVLPEDEGIRPAHPDEAFIDGTDVQARLGVCGTPCCLTIPFVGFSAALCSNCCENKVNIHHTEYEGDFIAPDNISMERSFVKGPASPRSRGKEAGGVHGFAGLNETVLAASDGVKLELKIQQ